MMIMLGFITAANVLTYMVNENLKRLKEDDKGIQESDRSELKDSGEGASLKTI